MDFTPSPSLNLNSTTLSSIKVLDALDSITIPRLRLDSRSSTSQQCTRIHHEVFKASVRAAKAARAENGIGPAFEIKPSDGMLDLLGGILVQGIKGDAMLDEKTICLIRSIPPRMELEKVGAEKTHHPQCRSVHGTVSGSLYGADIYRPAIILKKREWNIEESGPAQNHGKTDLLGQVSNMYGVMEKLVIWEYKRDLVLLLRHLITMYSLANEGDGVIIDLNDMGEVVMRCSDDDKLGDVKMFLQQVSLNSPRRYHA